MPAPQSAFTLVEITIVLVILAAIAAFAVPNLLEIRIANREAEAASRLATEVMPAMVQYHANARFDEDGDGQGESLYPGHVAALGGATVLAAGGAVLPGPALLSETYIRTDGSAATNARVNVDGTVTDAGAVIDDFVFSVVIDIAATADGRLNREEFVTIIASPATRRSGRRAFGTTINPHYFDAIWSLSTERPAGSLRSEDLILDAATAPDRGMFFRPIGYPRTGSYASPTWMPNGTLQVTRYSY